LERLPLAERGRAAAQVHDHVEDRAARTADELGHAAPDLEVHAADDPVARAGVVVLDELLQDPELGVYSAAVALVEEAALVAMDDGLDQHRPLKPGFEPYQSSGSGRWTRRMVSGLRR